MKTEIRLPWRNAARGEGVADMKRPSRAEMDGAALAGSPRFCKMLAGGRERDPGRRVGVRAWGGAASR